MSILETTGRELRSLRGRGKSAQLQQEAADAIIILLQCWGRVLVSTWVWYPYSEVEQHDSLECQPRFAA